MGKKRRYEDKSYYEEDHRPYDRAHFIMLSKALAWLEKAPCPDCPDEMPLGAEMADSYIAAWVSNGDLPLAYFANNFATGVSVKPWYGPPPNGAIMCDLIQKIRRHGSQQPIPVRMAIPWRPGNSVTDTIRRGEQVGTSLVMVHYATLLELAAAAGLLTDDMTEAADELTGWNAPQQSKRPSVKGRRTERQAALDTLLGEICPTAHCGADIRTTHKTIDALLAQVKQDWPRRFLHLKAPEWDMLKGALTRFKR